MANENDAQSNGNEKQMSDAEKSAYESGRARGRAEGASILTNTLIIAVTVALTGMIVYKKLDEYVHKKDLIEVVKNQNLLPDMRVDAIEKLAWRMDGQEISELVEKLAVDPDSKVRARAMGWMHACTDRQRAVEILLNALNDPKTEVIEEAISALSFMTDENELPSSKVEMQRNFKVLVEARKSLAGREDLGYYRETLKRIETSWSKMLGQKTAEKVGFMSRNPNVLRPPVLPREVNPVQRNYAQRRMG
jgi:hypothetical protein